MQQRSSRRMPVPSIRIRIEGRHMLYLLDVIFFNCSSQRSEFIFAFDHFYFIFPLFGFYGSRGEKGLRWFAGRGKVMRQCDQEWELVWVKDTTIKDRVKLVNEGVDIE